MTTEDMNTEHGAGATVIEFYWRPGCPYCTALRGQLRRSGLPVREINIWDDPQAAARVRSVAGGNETVPTLFVGTHAMVNPSMGQVLAAVREHAPALTPDAGPRAPWWQPAVAALGLALLWGLLAVRTPTTTYHLAPLLVAGAAPMAGRWRLRAPVRSRVALAWAVLGLLVALAAAAVLALRGLLAGPDITGGNAAVAETVLLAVLGAALGWWLARRGGRSTISR
jgi:glutaredoxin-like protein